MEKNKKPLLTDEQVQYINGIGLPFVVMSDLSLLSDDQFFEMSESVANYLVGGFGSDGESEDRDRVSIGEDIMNFIGEHF